MNRKLRNVIALVTGLACHGLANFTLAAVIMHFRPASHYNEEHKMAVKRANEIHNRGKGDYLQCKNDDLAVKLKNSLKV